MNIVYPGERSGRDKIFVFRAATEGSRDHRRYFSRFSRVLMIEGIVAGGKLFRTRCGWLVDFLMLYIRLYFVFLWLI